MIQWRQGHLWCESLLFGEPVVCVKGEGEYRSSERKEINKRWLRKDCWLVGSRVWSPTHLLDNTLNQLKMNEEEELLYGDLEETAQSAQAQKLMDQLSRMQKKNQNLQNEAKEWKEQVQLLLAEKKQVEENMVKLYNTALREIDRKDNEIAELKSTISHFRNTSS
jgi:predicted RNase H-like nuclease (RuvC/YqgF family)